jgi:cyclohexyl-isocyanide hydratase
MTLQVGLLTFPGVQSLDLIGPYEVFSNLPGISVHLVWKDLEPIQASGGIRFWPTATFDTCPELDVICVPGGKGVDVLVEDRDTLAFVAHHAKRARFITSVCTGALVLGAAGLLRGRRATTHWAFMDLLAPFGATAVRERVVQDGNLVTGGGVTAGIDFALALARELVGEEEAQAVQLHLEYLPAPPFNAGSVDTAPAAVTSLVRERVKASHARRSEIVARAAAAYRGGQ